MSIDMYQPVHTLTNKSIQVRQGTPLLIIHFEPLYLWDKVENVL